MAELVAIIGSLTETFPEIDFDELTGSRQVLRDELSAMGASRSEAIAWEASLCAKHGNCLTAQYLFDQAARFCLEEVGAEKYGTSLGAAFVSTAQAEALLDMGEARLALEQLEFASRVYAENEVHDNDRASHGLLVTEAQIALGKLEAAERGIARIQEADNPQAQWRLIVTQLELELEQAKHLSRHSGAIAAEARFEAVLDHVQLVFKESNFSQYHASDSREFVRLMHVMTDAVLETGLPPFFHRQVDGLLDELRNSYGENHPFVLRTKELAARVALREGKLAKADKLLRSAVGTQYHTHGEHSLGLAALHRSFGDMFATDSPLDSPSEVHGRERMEHALSQYELAERVVFQRLGEISASGLQNFERALKHMDNGNLQSAGRSLSRACRHFSGRARPEMETLIEVLRGKERLFDQAERIEDAAFVGVLWRSLRERLVDGVL